jgi:hypothetical protein
LAELLEAFGARSIANPFHLKELPL